MTRRLALLLAATSRAPAGPPGPHTAGARRFGHLLRTPPLDRGPISVACPRCGAGVGKPCDRRTLGAHRYHMARIRAAEELVP